MITGLDIKTAMQRAHGLTLELELDAPPSLIARAIARLRSGAGGGQVQPGRVPR